MRFARVEVLEMPTITKHRLQNKSVPDIEKHWGLQLTSIDRDQSAVCIICSQLKWMSVVVQAMMMPSTYAVQVGFRNLTHH